MLTGTTSRKGSIDVLTQVEYGLYYPSDIPSDREGNWNAAGLSLRSPRFLSNRWGPPHNTGVGQLFHGRLRRLVTCENGDD
jgi:hypothetical protein